jgi:hypothetical protein
MEEQQFEALVAYIRSLPLDNDNLEDLLMIIENMKDE